ncbi:cytokine receptor common subunit beta isoform X2 [Ctenopharyngodon idella]|uniref:cytokine receptor common subunit beta isoform X2 n=1 Tax=Ctenopharyngodon idella TaxID=7959 RepID=UPI0022321CD4|nr:cytokine receptor common subunit beta isoform X2 [Ctenopharyngodon idella]
MFSTWILHMASFTLLVRGDINKCTFYEVTPGKESPLMDSLQCYNDYNTYGQCSWEVDPQATGNISLFELHWVTSPSKKKSKCVPQRPGGVLLPNGKISHECRYKTRRFSLTTNHILFFTAPSTPRATILNVAQHGKVKAPTDLTEVKADGGSHLLSWRSPYPASSNITKTLVYQLQYRRHKHDWTTVDNINESKYMIDKESLLPGYHYQAKVRARGPVGLWSDWSPLVSWTTHNDEEVSGVYNLQCVIEGEKTVTCTWQMKTDHLQVMSYHLWCRDSNDAEPSACCEHPQLQSRDVELSEFMCSVTVSDPYLLTVELRPVQYSRTFKTSEHIKFSQPDQIQVMEEDGIFTMNWSVPFVKEGISYSTELKILSHKDSKNFTTKQGVSYYSIPSEILSPSTTYQAQIRLLHIPDKSYKGLPSDWSEPAVFTTKPVLKPISVVIYILVPVFVAVVFIILYNALPACHRRIKLWKGSVPSPIKSKVLEGIIKKSSTGWPHLQIEKEATSICVLLATDNISICKSSVSQEQLLLHTEDGSLNAVKMGQSCGSNHLCTYVGEGMCKDKSGMNFSGPYILCCEDSCSQDKGLDRFTDRDQTSVLGKTESFAPINGGYVVTPPTAMPATQNPAPVDSPTNNTSDEPPAYTPSPDQGCMVLPHPSGYFMMPCVSLGQSEPVG